MKNYCLLGLLQKKKKGSKETENQKERKKYFN